MMQAGAGGLPSVVLRAADGSATATVHQHGATLTSWAVSGAEKEEEEELLFVSPLAVFAPPKAIRGGAPVCWPQFGSLGPLKAQHGFARNMEWTIDEVAGDSCSLVLCSDAVTRAEWPHDFKLTMQVSLLPNGALKQSLRVLNTGDSPFEFTTALHTYFRVSDVSKASVVGLKGLSYFDNAAGSLATDDADAVTFTGEVDRAYIGAPSPLKLVDSGRGAVVMVHKEGFQDAVVWNPWEAKAAGMADLGPEHWRGFVCVEATQARSGAVTLAPGQDWEGRLRLERDTLGES
ncbi:putative glucose-6-phosphate 1-epimerase [Chlorella vulgaris]